MKKDRNNNLEVVTMELKSKANEIIRDGCISISTSIEFKHRGNEFILDYKVKSVGALTKQARMDFDNRDNRCYVKKFLGFGFRSLLKVSVLITAINLHELLLPAFEKMGSGQVVFLSVSLICLVIKIMFSIINDMNSLDRSLR